jgi:hypothetical protein
VSELYEGKQRVGIDVHRRRSVLVRMSESGEKLEAVRISNDRVRLPRVRGCVAVGVPAEPPFACGQGPW